MKRLIRHRPQSSCHPLLARAAQGAFTITRIDAEHVNPKRKWLELDGPDYPTITQLAEIEAASHGVVQPIVAEPHERGCVLRFTLPPHGVVAITSE